MLNRSFLLTKNKKRNKKIRPSDVLLLKLVYLTNISKIVL